MLIERLQELRAVESGLQDRREGAELLVAEFLLEPPVLVWRIVDARDRLAKAGQLIEQTVCLSLTDPAVGNVFLGFRDATLDHGEISWARRGSAGRGCRSASCREYPFELAELPVEFGQFLF